MLKQLVIAITLLLVLPLWQSTQANCFAPPSERKGNKNNLEMFQQAIAEHKQAQKRNRALCLIRGSQIKTKFKQAPLFIDVRDETGPHTNSLPGGLKIPLHEIKLKSFLKQKTFVIVSNGIALNHPLQTCGELRQRGFRDAYVLLDGIRAWDAQTPRSGVNKRDRQQAAGITSREWFVERNDRDWLIVNMSDYTSPRIKQYFESTKIVAGQKKNLKKRIKSHLVAKRPHSPPPAVVFIDETGASVGDSQALQQHWDRAAVYYLQGGQQAFEKYLHTQYLIARKSEYTLQKPRSCSP